MGCGQRISYRIDGGPIYDWCQWTATNWCSKDQDGHNENSMSLSHVGTKLARAGEAQYQCKEYRAGRRHKSNGREATFADGQTGRMFSRKYWFIFNGLDLRR